MDDFCKQCFAEVGEDEGYENRDGELMCNECFAEFWGPPRKGSQADDIDLEENLLAILVGDLTA